MSSSVRWTASGQLIQKKKNTDRTLSFLYHFTSIWLDLIFVSFLETWFHFISQAETSLTWWEREKKKEHSHQLLVSIHFRVTWVELVPSPSKPTELLVLDIFDSHHDFADWQPLFINQNIVIWIHFIFINFNGIALLIWDSGLAIPLSKLFSIPKYDIGLQFTEQWFLFQFVH